MSIFGSTLDELQQLCADEGLPRYVARQLCDWMYQKRATSFEQMTNLSLAVRARLAAMESIEPNYPIDCQVSRDGTKKYLFEEQVVAPDGTSSTQYVEAVYIPAGNATASPHHGNSLHLASIDHSTPDRATLCVSCQAGCRMNCSFCVTGRGGYHGNLTTRQILNQIFAIPESQQLTNIVYMGMGRTHGQLRQRVTLHTCTYRGVGAGLEPAAHHRLVGRRHPTPASFHRGEPLPCRGEPP